MLRITIELLPCGDESKARTIAIGTISNDGSGGALFGNYDVKLLKNPKYSKRPDRNGGQNE